MAATFDAVVNWLATLEHGCDRIGFRYGVADQSKRRRLEAVLRERLEPTELRALLGVGAGLAPRDAVALALAALEEMRADKQAFFERQKSTTIDRVRHFRSVYLEVGGVQTKP